MIRKVEKKPIDVSDGQVLIDGRNALDYISDNYEREANECFEEFQQIFSCCSVKRNNGFLNTNSDERIKNKILNLVEKMKHAKNQNDLDKYYKELSNVLNNVFMYVEHDEFLLEYLNKGQMDAEYLGNYRLLNSFQREYLLPSGQSIDEIRSIYRYDLETKMIEYIDTAYAHLSAKFEMEKEVKHLMKQHHILDVQENDEEKESIDKRIEKRKERIQQLYFEISLIKGKIANTNIRLSRLEEFELDGIKEVSDDDDDYIDWDFPMSKDPLLDPIYIEPHKDRNGNDVPFISTDSAIEKTKLVIDNLAKEIQTLQKQIEELEKEITDLEVQKAERTERANEVVEQVESRYFGMGKFRKAMAILTGKKAKMDRLIDQTKSGQFSDDDLDELDGTFRIRGVK